MPNRDERPRPKLGYGVNVRLTPAQHRGVEMLAEQIGESVSYVLRLAVEQYLDGYADGDGVTLLDELEREVANERVSTKRLAAFAQRG